MQSRAETDPAEDFQTSTDWEGLDSRVSTAVHEIQAALEEALGATRDLVDWVERLRTLSAFVREVESGLDEVRHQLTGPPSGHRPVVVPPAAPKPMPVKREEAWASGPAPAEPDVGERPLLTAVETAEAETEAGISEAPSGAEPEQPSEPAEGEPPPEGKPLEEAATATGGKGSVHLEIESSEANIDLMLVERALRETPGVADVELLDYAGKRAGVHVILTEGERSEETADLGRLAAHVQERLSKLTLDANISVSLAE
jgi:hypothetical protein